MYKTYLIITGIFLVSLVGSIFTYRNFHKSLLPSTPPIVTSSTPSPSPIVAPYKNSTPETKAILEKIADDQTVHSCTESSQCHTYNIKVYSKSNGSNHTLIFCGNEKIAKSYPDSKVASNDSPDYFNCVCDKSNVCDTDENLSK